jgi:hypothetical protein
MLNDTAAGPGPGRSCPSDYYYGAASLHRAADIETSTLYVVGGLYGNRPALDAIELMASVERAIVVFNGDFHWFDRSVAIFSDVDRRVRQHHALRGNVETELSRERDLDVGCGCAYPPDVGQPTVDRSNAILRELRQTARQCVPGPVLATSPMTMVVNVGGLRVGIVHGDCEALAGWRFSAGALDDSAQHGWLDGVRVQSAIDVFASSHTCLPVTRTFTLPSGPLVVANNGSAGMPNFSGTSYGVVTRIATRPRRGPVLHCVELGGVCIEAVALSFDFVHWHQEFLSQWPVGSPAWLSYWKRIVNGPHYSRSDAYPSHEWDCARPLLSPGSR